MEKHSAVQLGRCAQTSDANAQTSYNTAVQVKTLKALKAFEFSDMLNAEVLK